jgi:4-amino-4-deoxy-L-arabinose transferase-like glycosyltransferase
LRAAAVVTGARGIVSPSRGFPTQESEGQALSPTESGTLFGLARRTALLLTTLITVFAVVAVAYTFTYGRGYSKPGGDGKAYERSAVQLLQKGFYGYKSEVPNAYMSPGYPLFLAAIYKATGHTWNGRPRLALALIQILITCSTILAVFLIGRRLFNDNVGLIAALMFVLYPPNLVATNLWLTEALTTAILAWYLYVAVICTETSSWKPWLFSGALMGLVALIRPGVLPIAIAPFAVVFFWGDRKGFVRNLALTVAALVLVMAPWGIRNQIVVHKTYLLSSHSGDPILAGVDPYYYQLGDKKYEFHGPSYETWATTKPPYTKSEYAKKIILANLKSDPLSTIWWFTMGKTVRMYSVNWLAENGSVSTWTTFVRMFIVVLGWVGVAFSVRERRLRMLAIALVMGTAALLSVSPEPRYAFSWVAFLTIPAAVVLLRVFGNSDVLDGPRNGATT